tara:strand:- start:631 stop:1137 length:507 start_codon:yes stop_codon:yes gene_type:complete
MKHAIIDNFDDIMGVFKQYGDLFPHIRGDKITTMIEAGNVVWEDEVLITYNHYKRKQKLGLIEQSMFGKGPYVKVPYEAQEGDCILHQIAAKNQGDGSGKRVFERFIEYNDGRDIILSVRSENKRARLFYEKYGFEIVSDIEWGKEKQVKGKVYVLDQKNKGWKRWTS